MRPFHNIHPEFRLNGQQLGYADVKETAHSLVERGLPFETSIGMFLLDWLGNSETVEVQTSGSTGSPKKIHLKKEHMLNSAKATASFFKLISGNSALHCLPSHFIAGKMMLVRAMTLGWHLDYVPPSASPLPQNEKTYDFSAMVPLQLQNSLKQIDRIKTLIVGGAPVSYSLHKRIKKRNTRIFETYGMTETCTHIAVKHLNPKHIVKSGRQISSFTTLPNVVISKDKRNCLVIDAPEITDGKIVTNDVVEISAKNKFIWLGRLDNVVNSGGIKLFPEKIEQVLSGIIRNRFFVYSEVDDTLGQKLILLVEGNIDKDKVLENINASGLHTYEIPKELKTVPHFMETKNGKINRRLTLAQTGK